jgi:hypothetical protein
MDVSFVDRDMIMRYFGGGVGHLKNTPPQQVHRSDPVDISSEEMELEDDGNTRGDLQDIIMSNRELEVGEDDEEMGQDENDDDNDDNDDNTDDDSESDDDSEDEEDRY